MDPSAPIRRQETTRSPSPHRVLTTPLPPLFPTPFMKLNLNLLLLTVLLAVIGSASLGCRNTASGFGKDVENAGEKIQEKVD